MLLRGACHLLVEFVRSKVVGFLASISRNNPDTEVDDSIIDLGNGERRDDLEQQCLTAARHRRCDVNPRCDVDMKIGALLNVCPGGP